MKMNLDMMRKRAKLLAEIRAFFTAAGYLEVDTPLLAPFLIPESSIEAFTVPTHAANPCSRDLYLIPSPELWMKRLLAGGSGSIFQICHSFRNLEERTPLHAPEFTMLEWYTLGITYRESMEITERLIRRAYAAVDNLTLPAAPFARATMADLFTEHTGLNLKLLNSTDAIREAAASVHIRVGPQATWEECFNKIFLTYVEPELPLNRPLFVTDYPAAIPTLARAEEGDSFAERWELYIHGVEIANCYTEETDSHRISRFVREESARKQRRSSSQQADRGLETLRIPPCSGVAMGMDRLLMVSTGAPALERVIFFPLSDTIAEESP